jgi:hypothetical protein
VGQAHRSGELEGICHARGSHPGRPSTMQGMSALKRSRR